MTIFTQISVTKREAEMKLDETDFFERKMINKRKKLIMAGMDPDEVEEFLQNRYKPKKFKRRKIKTDANQEEQTVEKSEKKEESISEKEKPTERNQNKILIKNQANKKDEINKIESKSILLKKKSKAKSKKNLDNVRNLIKKRKKFKV